MTISVRRDCTRVWRMSWGHGLIRQAISGQQATGVVNKLVVGEALREREKRGPLSLHNIPLINFAGRKWSDQHLHLVGLNLEKSESALTFLWFAGNDQPILSQGQKETNHLAIIISQPVEMLYIFDQQQQQKLHSPAHKLGFLLWRCFKFPKSLDLNVLGVPFTDETAQSASKVEWSRKVHRSYQLVLLIRKPHVPIQ